MINISIYHYANLSPLRALGVPEGYQFIYQNPRETVTSFNHNSVLAAPIPVGALPDLTVDYENLGAYGVAASEQVGSVLLYSNINFQELNKNHKLYLTSQSATSVLLLFTLLHDQSAEDLPTITTDITTADVILIIGDDALIFPDKAKYQYCFDLVTLWHEHFNLPFVFARWVVRKDADTQVKEALNSWLNGLDSHDGKLVNLVAPIEARRLNLTTAQMSAYLLGMRRKLTHEDLAGQEFFINKIQTLAKAYQHWRTVYSASARILSDHAAFLHLLTDAPLGELMAQAHELRMKKHPGGLVTYVMDTNPNYTNICTIDCSFCAFHKLPGSADSYTLTAEELAERVKLAELKEATTVLLQGGLHPAVKLTEILEYIRAIKSVSPRMHIHPLSPTEIDYLAKLEGISAEYILQTLWDEGITTMPGGGAEILVDRVRKCISPRKCSASRWLEIMEIAHRIGYKTTATMMYGHIETPEDILEHLFALRNLQERTGGFSSFIAWSFKPANSKLGEQCSHPAHPAFYVRLIAVARIILDNFDHIQSSWFSETENAGCLGLMAGADDFGGVLVEENVLKTAGHERKTTVERVHQLIRQSGFIPARRDSHYLIKEILD